MLDQERIALAKEVVEVAKADVKAAEARLKEAEAILDKYEAEVERWDTEVKRLTREVDTVVVDPADPPRVDQSAQVEHRGAGQGEGDHQDGRRPSCSPTRATLAKAEVDVRVAEADLKVAESEEKRLKAWVDYLTLTAPFDGVITARNANTFDFVLPTTGDPSAFYLLPRHLARRHGRADLRGRPHRHRPDLRRRPRAGRQLRPHRHQGDRAGQGRTATSRSRPPSRAPPGR